MFKNAMFRRYIFFFVCCLLPQHCLLIANRKKISLMIYFQCESNTRLMASAKGNEEMKWYTKILLARARHTDKQ